MSQTILRPLSNGLYTAPKGVAHFYEFANSLDPNSALPGVRLGDMNSFQVNVTVEKQEIDSNEYGVSTTVAERISKVSVEVTIELKQLSPVVQAASVLGRRASFAQVAAPGQTLEVSEPGVYKLAGFGVSMVNVVDDTGLVLVNNVDYMLDSDGGQVQILTEGIRIVSYDVPAISNKFASGIASGNGIRGSITLVHTNTDGVRNVLVLNDIELTPSAAREFITSGSEPQTVTLTGKAYPVAGKPAGFEIGFIKEI